MFFALVRLEYRTFTIRPVFRERGTVVPRVAFLDAGPSTAGNFGKQDVNARILRPSV